MVRQGVYTGIWSSIWTPCCSLSDGSTSLSTYRCGEAKEEPSTISLGDIPTSSSRLFNPGGIRPFASRTLQDELVWDWSSRVIHLAVNGDLASVKLFRYPPPTSNTTWSRADWATTESGLLVGNTATNDLAVLNPADATDSVLTWIKPLFKTRSVTGPIVRYAMIRCSCFVD